MATPPPDSGGIVWEDPPSRATWELGPLLEQITAMAATLRANRGRWAKLCETPGKSTSYDRAMRLRKQLDRRLADIEIKGSRVRSGAGGAVYVRARPEGA